MGRSSLSRECDSDVRQNKLAIAQSGAIQPLVAMLYSDVREAQVRNGTEMAK